MSASYNRILMIGNLTRDPVLTYTPSQTAVVDFGLASNRKWNDASGQVREEVCFVDCRCFGKLAETIQKYVVKGQPLFIEGRLVFNSWTAQDGTKKSKHLVTVESFQFLGDGNSARTTKPEQAAPEPHYSPPPAPEPYAGPGIDESLIPF